jgi:cellulose biosynthesis protein BcsE
VYVVLHDDGQALEMTCQTLVAACAQGRAEWVPEIPSAYLGMPAELGQDIAECMGRGDLRIFEAKAEGERSGLCRRMLQELDYLGAAQSSLILVEGVDRFVEQAENWESEAAAWQQWAERKGCAVLWLCPRRAGQAAHESELLRMAHRFSGLARLRASGDEVRWDVYYWFADDGMVVDKSFRLDTDGDGNWWVDQRDSLRSEAAERAVDEDDVFIMRAALPGGRTTPAGWRVFETVEQMNVALSSAHAPTVVFHYDVGSPLEAIARSVFELRSLIGPYVKIAVKETGGRLRHSHEQLLLNMGANLTIPSETGIARMTSLLKTIQGQAYSRILPPDFEEAMASVVAVARTGYLAPAGFTAAVSEVMERGRSLGVHNALVRLALTPGLGVIETLRCCTMKRPGDLCTADDESVYVFLFACEEQNIGATLDRLFRLPVSVLFSGESRFLSADDIDDALAEFGLRIKGADYADYTAALAEKSGAEALPAASVPLKAPTRPPFTAVPQPLKLRTAPV